MGLLNTQSDKPLEGDFVCLVVSSTYKASKAGNLMFHVSLMVERELVDGEYLDTPSEGQSIKWWGAFTKKGQEWTVPFLIALGHEYDEDDDGNRDMPFTAYIEGNPAATIHDIAPTLAAEMKNQHIGVQLYTDKRDPDDLQQGVGKGFFQVPDDAVVTF